MSAFFIIVPLLLMVWGCIVIYRYAVKGDARIDPRLGALSLICGAGVFVVALTAVATG